MNALAVLDRICGSDGSWNALRSPSNSDRCVCMPLPGLVPERLGHERRVHALRDRDLFDHVPERHDVVGHRQRVGVAQVDLLLAGRHLVVAELDRDAQALERRHRLAAEVVRRVVAGHVEVAAGVDRHRLGAVGRAVLEQEELDLGVGVEGESALGRLRQGAAQDVARDRPTTASRRASGCRRTSAPSRVRGRPARAGSGRSPGRGGRSCRSRWPGRSPRSPSRRSRCPRRTRRRVRPARPPPTSGCRARR